MHIYKRAKYHRYFSVKDSGKTMQGNAVAALFKIFGSFFKLMDTLVTIPTADGHAFRFIRIHSDMRFMRIGFPQLQVVCGICTFSFLEFANIRFVYYRIQDILTKLISTDGALRLPTTYDNHPSIPSHSTQSHPTHPHIAVKTTSPLKI